MKKSLKIAVDKPIYSDDTCVSCGHRLDETGFEDKAISKDIKKNYTPSFSNFNDITLTLAVLIGFVSLPPVFKEIYTGNVIALPFRCDNC